MPARTGQEYISGLKERPREVWLDGERVKDVTTHPGPAQRRQVGGRPLRYAA